MSVGSRLSSVNSGRPGAASHSPVLGCQAHWKRGLSSSRAVWLKVFACDIRVQSLALITHKGGEALVLASKHGALATALVVEPEEEPTLVEDQASESPQKRKIDEDEEEVPIVSRR